MSDLRSLGVRSVATIGRFILKDLILDFAKALQDTENIPLHVYCERPEHVDWFLEKGAGFIGSAQMAPSALDVSPLSDINPEETWRRAAEIEAASGVTFGQIAVTDRFLGLGFALGGGKVLQPPIADQANWLQTVDRYLKDIDFWTREMEVKDIGLAMLTAGAAGAKQMAIAAKLRNLPFRAVNSARYKNLQAWHISEYFDSNVIKPAYDRLSGDEHGAEMDAPYFEHQVGRKILLETRSRRTGVLRDIVYAVTKHLRLRCRGRPSMYPLGDVIRSILSDDREYRELIKLSSPSHAMGGRPYIFFPLQLEPEPALSQLSPEYFFQLSAIASVARDLPAHAILAVKEHLSAIGRRPTGFYQQIRRIKNVLLIDPREPGLDLVRGAAAVATINSTAGFEAAGMGIPVVTFGRHNAFNFLPHVHVVTGFGDLQAPLAAAVGRAYDQDKARRAGRRFLAAVAQSSFDLGEFNFVSGSTYQVGAGYKAYRALLETFAQDK